MPDAFSHLTVGVADMRPVRDLWLGHFGLEVVAERRGPDAGLATLWNLEPDRIAEQLLLRTPGAHTGWLHFVRFDPPGPPVRDGAAPTDPGPKNIDVNTPDMAPRFDALAAAGFCFRSGMHDYRVGGIEAREVQMSAHDETNIVLVQILSDGYEIDYSPAGFGAVTSFVSIVPDTAPDARFLREHLGLDEAMHQRISGPEIEAIVGLPPGAELDMRVLGTDDNLFGRIEIIAYEGISGTDRFSRARPPATGALHIAFCVPSVTAFAERAAAAGAEVRLTDVGEVIFGAGTVASLQTPSGLRIEVFQCAD